MTAHDEHSPDDLALAQNIATAYQRRPTDQGQRISVGKRLARERSKVSADQGLTQRAKEDALTEDTILTLTVMLKALPDITVQGVIDRLQRSIDRK